ncbi:MULTISPECIES: DoxX family protein [unclassified Moritella]|uniref:DoxX family protein n=1 Tax=unclassified Moritella TaxID=2637987 RepID=UPI001BA4C6BF|nr:MULTISPECIES: DoxX family protein [unclassified Moritella]QUM85092.1 DoxX family protein [Moritella sp. 28]QUM89326.1 DoxX family protein [Moritella sp. 36]
MNTSNSLLLSANQIYRRITEKVSMLEPVALLAARFYVGWAFFSSGLTKLNSWDSTLFLFEEEYHVPLLPYELAAYLGTAAEIILPLLLMAGLASRFSALGLFFVNIVAVISLEDIAAAAYAQHILWGTLLLQVVIFSGGRFTFDYVVKRKVDLT